MSKGNPSPVKKWKPGQSGNPKGKPALPWTQAVRDVMNADTVEVTLIDENGNKKTISRKVGDKKTVRHAIVSMLGLKALSGDIHAASTLADREDGKAEQPIDINSNRNKFDDMTEDEINDYLIAHGVDPKKIK